MNAVHLCIRLLLRCAPFRICLNVGYDIELNCDSDSKANSMAAWRSKDASDVECGMDQSGYLQRLLQPGERLSFPQSRPMPSIGAHYQELRINDANKTWRIVYRIDYDAIIILDMFETKTERTPKDVINNCKRRIQLYES